MKRDLSSFGTTLPGFSSGTRFTPSCREAATEGSQGQARSAQPLDHVPAVSRHEGAREASRSTLLRTLSGCVTSLKSFTRGGVPIYRDLPLATIFHAFGVMLLFSVGAVSSLTSAVAQARTYPKEIRGYKVERAAVELKSTAEAKKPAKSTPGKTQDAAGPQNGGSSSNQVSAPSPTDPAVDKLITFGSPSLARVTPLGITLNIPVVVAPIKQSGHVDFLLFEDMRVNEHSVEIDEYHRGFDLPTKKALTLREPLRFFIYTPVAALAAVGELSNSEETWPVTGRVYVCGRYKKFLLTFKRCVPVELNLTMRNPLREG